MRAIRALAIVMLAAVLSACATSGDRSPAAQTLTDCNQTRYPDYQRCVLGLTTAQLGFETAAQRQQYLIYAEKLVQDQHREGLPDRAAREALAVRHQRLLTDPAAALQCARFAERILCY